ncbi:glycosyltransferase [Aerococcaceae bacterium INB8]|uniref:Glycosyltransferase n=1 Tax=Ruoffia halotolerans TaxID=2748684 RepID=A0A839A7X8_9LACT|nr:ATP-grasp fold amidoligase family protein [Ruoffia halotolerans]MBA5730177.1 glycosyltransferase [Ruoffia halotolerans]
MNITKYKDYNNLLYFLYIKYKKIKMKVKEYNNKKLDNTEIMKKVQQDYNKFTGKNLDWSKLETYNEKMQWSKINNDVPFKTILSDKYKVRAWVKTAIGEEYLIPILGVWDNYKEIDFDYLPNKFVLKTNNASGSNLIVKDKKNFNSFRAKLFFDMWLSVNFAYLNGFQMQYKRIEPKIIAESFIADSNGELNDFKFLCFDGKPYYCWVDFDRFEDHKRNVYDMDWNLQPWNQHNYSNTDFTIEKPKNFELMKDLVKRLSAGLGQVRVDLYNVDGKIYFGEMTFTNGNGFELIKPDEYNLKLGQLWSLENEKKVNKIESSSKT